MKAAAQVRMFERFFYPTGTLQYQDIVRIRL